MYIDIYIQYIYLSIYHMENMACIVFVCIIYVPASLCYECLKYISWEKQMYSWCALTVDQCRNTTAHLREPEISQMVSCCTWKWAQRSVVVKQIISEWVQSWTGIVWEVMSYSFNTVVAALIWVYHEYTCESDHIWLMHHWRLMFVRHSLTCPGPKINQ